MGCSFKLHLHYPPVYCTSKKKVRISNCFNESHFEFAIAASIHSLDSKTLS